MKWGKIKPPAPLSVEEQIALYISRLLDEQPVGTVLTANPGYVWLKVEKTVWRAHVYNGIDYGAEVLADFLVNRVYSMS